jgi:hypothetical protein
LTELCNKTLKERLIRYENAITKPDDSLPRLRKRRPFERDKEKIVEYHTRRFHLRKPEMQMLFLRGNHPDEKLAFWNANIFQWRPGAGRNANRLLMAGYGNENSLPSLRTARKNPQLARSYAAYTRSLCSVLEYRLLPFLANRDIRRQHHSGITESA